MFDCCFGFFIWLAWLTSGIQHKIIKDFDPLVYSDLLLPTEQCPPLFIPFLGLTFRRVGFVLHCQTVISPCLSHIFLNTFFLRPFLFPPSARKLWSLNDILRKMPTGLFILFCLFFGTKPHWLMPNRWTYVVHITQHALFIFPHLSSSKIEQIYTSGNHLSTSIGTLLPLTPWPPKFFLEILNLY